jgi:hypothetical protein
MSQSGWGITVQGLLQSAQKIEIPFEIHLPPVEDLDKMFHGGV